MDTETQDLDKKKKGREILDLNVGEVSPVDRPAVLEEFIVIKRREQEDSMGAFDSDQDGTGAIEVGYQWIDIDLEKRLDAGIISATKPATEFLEAVEKGECEHLKEDVLKAIPADLKSAITRVLAFLGKVAGGKYPYPKPAGKADKEEEETKKAIGDVADWTEKEEVLKELPDDLKAALTTVMGFLRKVAAGAPVPTEKSQGKQDDTDTKPDDKTDDKPDEGVDVEKRVQSYLEEIFKGKRFTDARKEGIATMAKQALALLSEVDPESVRKIITEKVQAMKGELKWPKGESDEKDQKPADMKKDIEDAVSKALEPFREGLAKVSTRVEDIEKTRQPSKSGDSDSTDKVDGQKEESVWKGLPVV